jgi:hypothetical protein
LTKILAALSINLDKNPLIAETTCYYGGKLE